MKGTKDFFTLLIFSIAVGFTGCSPIGSLLVDSNTGAALEFIRAVPNKFVYGPSDPFIPKSEVDVFGVFNGKEKPIAIEETDIKVSGYPFSTDDEVIVLDELDKKLGIQLNSGMKNISISYKGKETLYRISVGEAETGEGGNGGGDGPGIIIDWKWPED